jgi:hypothetical protein
MENQEKNEQILGEIFGSVIYRSNEELNQLIDNITDEQISYFISLSLTSAFQRGAFTMVETEIVSKILRKL